MIRSILAIARRSALSVVRSPLKSILFLVLIGAVSLFALLGAGMWAAAEGILAQGDSTFTTIASVDYVGQYYPNEDDYDAGFAENAGKIDLSRLETDPSVLSWLPNRGIKAVSAGYHRPPAYAAFSSWGVFIVSDPTVVRENSLVMLTVEDSLFGLTDKTGRIIKIPLESKREIVGEFDNLQAFYEAYTAKDNDGKMKTYDASFGRADGIPLVFGAYYEPTEENPDGVVRSIRVERGYHYVIDNLMHDKVQWDKDMGQESTLRVEGVTGMNVTMWKTWADSPFERKRKYVVYADSPMGGDKYIAGELPDYVYDALGVTREDMPPRLDITDFDGDITDDPDNPYMRLAAFFEAETGLMDVTFADDLENVFDFAQGIVKVKEGAMYTAEQASDERVCLVTEMIAGRLHAEVGDEIPLTFTYGLNFLTNDFDGIMERSETEAYRIVGIVAAPDDMRHYIYVPRSGGERLNLAERGGASGYHLGEVTLKNGTADAFLSAMSYLPDDVRITVYDQGYSNFARALNAVKATALAVLAVCSVVALTTLILFALLFVFKQRETVDVMLMFGSGAGLARLYLLFGASLAAAAGIAVGVAGGLRVSGGVNEMALKRGFESLKTDYYSDATIGVIKEAVYTIPTIPANLWITVSAVVFALAAIFMAAFARRTIALRSGFAAPVKKERKTKSSITAIGPKREEKSASLRGGALKYAWLSIRRGGARTAVVPAVCAAMAVFFAGLTVIEGDYVKRVGEAYDTAVIRGGFVDISGRSAENLVIKGSNLDKLKNSGFFADFSAYRSVRFALDGDYGGVILTREGEYNEVTPYTAANGEFSLPVMQRYLKAQPTLYMTNSFDGSPEFARTEPPAITFWEGTDELRNKGLTLDKSLFGDMDGKRYEFVADDETTITALPCVAAEQLLNRVGARLGDVVRLYYVATQQTIKADGSFVSFQPDPVNNPAIRVYDSNVAYSLDLLVIGSFNQAGARPNIYCPFPYPDYLADFNDVTITTTGYNDRTGSYETTNTLREMISFGAANFTMKSAGDIRALNDFLFANGYSAVGRLNDDRSFIIVHDKEFKALTGDLERHLGYIRALFPILGLAALAISAFVSYLLLSARKGEFAIMRGLGTNGLAAFMSFFLEQLLLCVISIGAVAAVFAVAGGLTPSLLLNCAGFAAVYLAGGAAAVVAFNRVSALKLFAEKE